MIAFLSSDKLAKIERPAIICGFGVSMTRTALKSVKTTYRTLLLKKRSELLESAKSEPEALMASVQSPDAAEFAARTVEQDLAVATVDLRRGMLKEIERALKRIVSGTYGTCEACGEQISAGRLKALPWARYCVTCQELQSRN